MISIHEVFINIQFAFDVDISECIKHCFKNGKYPPYPLPKDITLYSMIVLSMGVTFYSYNQISNLQLYSQHDWHCRLIPLPANYHMVTNITKGIKNVFCLP